jgi:hypothetical protein
VLEWNRQRFIKDPTTGKRQARLNPPEEWVRRQVPDLRIVDEELWQRVKARQGRIRETVTENAEGTVRSARARRPIYFLSHLVKCGCCGGGFSKISRDHYGCSNARNRGTCENMLTIRRDVLEESVLSGLRSHLLAPELLEEFTREYVAELNRLNLRARRGPVEGGGRPRQGHAAGPRDHRSGQGGHSHARHEGRTAGAGGSVRPRWRIRCPRRHPRRRPCILRWPKSTGSGSSGCTRN